MHTMPIHPRFHILETCQKPGAGLQAQCGSSKVWPRGNRRMKRRREDEAPQLRHLSQLQLRFLFAGAFREVVSSSAPPSRHEWHEDMWVVIMAAGRQGSDNDSRR